VTRIPSQILFEDVVARQTLTGGPVGCFHVGCPPVVGLAPRNGTVGSGPTHLARPQS
jgi:hypothetical protein